MATDPLIPRLRALADEWRKSGEPAFSLVYRIDALLSAHEAATLACPHCGLPSVMPEVCTPELNAVIQKDLERDGQLFYAGMEHQAAQHVIPEAATPAPIALNAAQEHDIKRWAADDRLWTTQETVEFNLRTVARKILASAEAAPMERPERRVHACGAEHDASGCPLGYPALHPSTERP
jgi:hypothetical protein